MRKQPLEFRKEETNYITQRWLASETCSLVGVGSVGKSNLLQHLADSDVHLNYMKKSTHDFKAIIIDPNMLGTIPKHENSEQISSWAGYELMMHRLYSAFYPFDMLSDSEAVRFYETYQALQDGTNPLYAYMGLRYFELGLQYFMRQGIQIVFMFDEFEEVLRQMPVKFFQALRGIRDMYKEGLAYLTFTRAPIPVLVENLGINPLDIEPFTELFTDNVYYVGPYNEKDAHTMVQHLINSNQKTYPDYVLNFLLASSGRYAGILRASFRMLDTLGEIYPADTQNEVLINKLASRRPVRNECRTIWTSLTPPEQVILKAVARLSSYDSTQETEDAIGMLVQKRLLRVDQQEQQLHIDPPIFRAFLATNPDVE